MHRQNARWNVDASFILVSDLDYFLLSVKKKLIIRHLDATILYNTAKPSTVVGNICDSIKLYSQKYCWKRKVVQTRLTTSVGHCRIVSLTLYKMGTFLR